MEHDHKQRIAHNEANARDLNERLGVGTFMCECGDSACHQTIRMPMGVYSSIRADARRFMVSPGHEMLEAEDVVIRKDDWYVVRKHDAVADVVEQRDPRSS
jgi:hypothetical protein